MIDSTERTAGGRGRVVARLDGAGHRVIHPAAASLNAALSAVRAGSR